MKTNEGVRPDHFYKEKATSKEIANKNNQKPS
jgi:hypothetical protein